MSFKIETGNVEVDVLLPYKLSYKVYLPENYKNTSATFPLVLFLHGVGERGNDLDLVEKHGLPKVIKKGERFPFITVAPQCPDQEWWSRAEMIKCLVHLIKKITKVYNVDDKKIYVTGLSMGGYGTIALANQRPDLFAAALPICGGADFSDYSNLKGLPLWFFHGSDDEEHPASYSENIYNALKNQNNDVKLTIYEGVGHNSWDITYDNKEIYDWLLSKEI